MGFLILLLVAGQGRACTASESRGRRNPNPHCSFSWEFDSIRLSTGTSSNCMHICFFYLPLSRPPPNPSQNLSCVLGGVWFDLVALNDVALSVGVQKRWEEKKNFFLLLWTTTEKIFLDMDPFRLRAGGNSHRTGKSAHFCVRSI